ncbi:MAG TPA: DUF5691 domain-containing protein [Terriglobia bacterium]|nr:DUF5691 domain-containing protein [Terriglobia bacterium]
MRLADLTAIALLGTERVELPPVRAGTAIGDLQSQLDFSRRESALLSAAALTAAYERAGVLPLEDHLPVPTACEAESRQQVGVRAGVLLQRMLGGEFSNLLPEWLEQSAALGALAPPELLPALLELGAKSSALRDAILPVIGERGRWLAAQNPGWSWVEGVQEDDGVWHTGATAARSLFLTRLRRSDADRARDLLMSTWNEESPEDRATFLNALGINLSPADEAFLESALDDRRKEVRRAASALLGRLPSSALAQRMVARARPLLRFVPGESGSIVRLKRATPAMIDVTLPQTCDKATQRDGVELKPPHGMGEKAFWLIQILEVTPLEQWKREFGAGPEEILTASLHGEWKTELTEAWKRAAIRQSNPEWAEAILDAFSEAGPDPAFRPLLDLLSIERREARVTRWLVERSRPELCGVAVAQSTHRWSEGFSRSVLEWLRRLAEQPSMDWQLRSELKNLAARIHPKLLPEASLGWPVDSAGWAFWSKGCDEMWSVVHFRHEMLTALQQSI